MSPARRRARTARVLEGALRMLWFVVIPALLAAIAVRAPIPPLAPVAAKEPVLLGLGVFLAVVVVVRYWGARLPGGSHLAPRATATLEPAARLRRGLVRAISIAALIAIAAASASLVRARVAEPYRVLGGSMLPTFEPAEYVAAWKPAYAALGGGERTPRRGDVVVFRARGAADELCKRVIGLPGDRVSLRAGFPIINGWEVPHCDAGQYAHFAAGQAQSGRLVVEFLDDRAYLTLHVPGARPAEAYDVLPNEVFVLGDNRNRSLDSRHGDGGKPRALPLADVVGRVDWHLLRTRRDHSSDASLLFRAPSAELAPPGLEPRAARLDLHAESLDLRDLRRAVERCLRERPRATRPPPRPVAVSHSR